MKLSHEREGREIASEHQRTQIPDKRWRDGEEMMARALSDIAGVHNSQILWDMGGRLV